MSSNTRLIRRGGIYHYRRRVPDALVAAIGKREIQRSLETTNLAEAKRRRAIEDIRWDSRFRSVFASPEAAATTSTLGAPSVTSQSAMNLVYDYVARLDERASRSALEDPPSSETERERIRENLETEIGILCDRDDPRADEWISQTISKVTAAAPPGAPIAWGVAFAETVRRGLLELRRRSLSRLDDQPTAVFDPAFDPARAPDAIFGDLANQHLQLTEEEAAANGTSRKWVDKQRANVALLTEILGTATLIQKIDYDACLRVRSVLAHLPANRTKFYEGLSIDQAIEAGRAEGKSVLSPTTQQVYLATLREILDLALRKRLIVVNPADGLRPLKKDTVVASAKRLPFTPVQLKQVFEGRYYRACAGSSPPWSHDKHGWRFWLPLLCLFMGMRPNEVCQMLVSDVRRTNSGTWYIDVVASSDEDDDDKVTIRKVLKTATSRRKIPIHPELLAIGFLDFVTDRRNSRARLFPHLKADEYGNCAKYAMKRFREVFLPAEIVLGPRQSFYSFRHNFRDALRTIGAPPDALQALGGWSQGRLVSDSYGDVRDPDFQLQFVKKIAFRGISLGHLHSSISGR